MKALVIADAPRADRLARPLETAGVEVALSVGHGHGKLDRIRWSRQVLADARAGQDVIISDTPGPIALVGAQAARQSGCPFVMRWRGDPWQEYDDPLNSRRAFGLKPVWGKWVLRQIVARSDLLVPVSRSLARSTVAATNCDPAKIVTVPIPVDTERFVPGDAAEARASLGLDCEHLITLAFQFHYVDKIQGPATFLPALRAFVQAHDDAAVLIAGEGKERERFMAEHAALLDHPRLIMGGHCKEMPLLYQACDAFCHFSFFDACPNVMLEAWSSGRPVVVNDFRPLVDLVEETGAGSVVDSSGDADEIVSVLEGLAYDSQPRERLGEAGRRAAVEKFSFEVVGRRLVETISTVLP